MSLSQHRKIPIYIRKEKRKQGLYYDILSYIPNEYVWKYIDRNYSPTEWIYKKKGYFTLRPDEKLSELMQRVMNLPSYFNLDRAKLEFYNGHNIDFFYCTPWVENAIVFMNSEPDDPNKEYVHGYEVIRGNPECKDLHFYNKIKKIVMFKSF